jgi:hypothetical protein
VPTAGHNTEHTKFYCGKRLRTLVVAEIAAAVHYTQHSKLHCGLQSLICCAFHNTQRPQQDTAMGRVLTHLLARTTLTVLMPISLAICTTIWPTKLFAPFCNIHHKQTRSASRSQSAFLKPEHRCPHNTVRPHSVSMKHRKLNVAFVNATFRAYNTSQRVSVTNGAR